MQKGSWLRRIQICEITVKELPPNIASNFKGIYPNKITSVPPEFIIKQLVIGQRNSRT